MKQNPVNIRKVSITLLQVMLIILLCISQGWAESGDDEGDNKDDPRVRLSGLNQGSLRPGGRTVMSPKDSRWGLTSELGLIRPSFFDPYNINPIKGDLPIFGKNTFMVFTNVLVPKGLFDNQANVDNKFVTDNVTSMELFRGATVFKPKDWSLKASGKAIFNRGNNQDDENFGLLELFGELKLFDVGDNYDFTATRNGMQFFLSDFNGFIFQDFNLGYQLFGELAQNRYRWTAAMVDRRVKEAGGILTFDALNQQVFFANWFWEDFLRGGFNTVTTFHYDRNRIDAENPVDAFFAGISAAGHWGRIVFNPAFFYAFGNDDNQADPQTISAFLTGVEMAYPIDYLNYRAAAFFSSGDNDPDDGLATGFSSIKENINLFGAGNSFIVGGNAFTNGNSFIPSNQGPSAFVNPGLILLNAGLDVVVSPKLFFTTNFNHAQFVNVESAENTNNTALGFETNAAINYRLFLNENLIIQAGVNAFFPQQAGIDILGSAQTVVTGNVTLVTVF